MPAGPQPRWGAGRLEEAVPRFGEDFHALASLHDVRIEHIVSSATPALAEQVQGWDEWVLVLVGSATLLVADATVHLARHDWLFIPAGTRHRLVSTQHGTQWLAVHAAHPGPGSDPAGSDPAGSDQPDDGQDRRA